MTSALPGAELQDAAAVAALADWVEPGTRLFARPWEFTRGVPSLEFLPEADRPQQRYSPIPTANTAPPSR